MRYEQSRLTANHPLSSDQTVAVDEASVDPDPMTQLSRWLETARSVGEPMPEAMAMAVAVVMEVDTTSHLRS